MMRYSYFLLLCACASEEGVKVYNNDPTSIITSHSDGEQFMSGYSINLLGMVSDDNHPSTDLLVKWSSDVRELCAESAPDYDGSTACQTTLSDEDSQIKLQVIDPEGAAFVDIISIEVQPTEAPQVSIISPESSGSYYANQLILFSALLQDDEDIPEDLAYVWSSSIDGTLPITSVPESSGEIEQFLNLTPGQHAITLTVTDQSNKTSTETVAITVGGANNDPTCSVTGPEEGSTYITGQNIFFSGTANDDELNNSLLSIYWESNRDGLFDTTAASSTGELGFGYNGLSLGAHTITLKVEDEAGGLCTDTLQISVGSAPTLSLLSPLTGDVYTLLEAVPFSAQVSDPEDIASDISLSWESSIDGVFSTTGSDSSGNISFALNSLSAGIHNIFVTATDSAGLTASTSLILNINTPPPAPTLSITPSSPHTSDDIVVNIGETPDPDGDTLSYSYVWKRNGINTTHTSNNISAADTAADEVWAVIVTPNDGYIDGTSAEALITILNTPPTIDSISIDNITPGGNDTITCTATATDPDGAAPLTYLWSNTTTSIQYGTNPILDLSTLSLSVNDVITCAATATDSQGEIDMQSTTAIITYVGPSFDSNATISPSTAYTEDTLTCSASAVDGNNNTLSVAYHWEISGIVISSGGSYTVSASDTDVGDILWCYATATDSQGMASTSSDSISISNTAPSISNIAINNNQSVYNDSTASCSANLTDPDDTPTVSYEWSLNGSMIGSTSSISLVTHTPQYGDVLTCAVTAVDPQGLSSTDSIDQSIENRAPTPPTISLSPTAPIEGQDDLICSITGTGSDADGDSLTYSFSWMVDTIPYTASTNAASSSTILASATTSGEEWICLVTPNDGITDGTPATSSVTITSDWSDERVFTTCGQTGRTGPSQSLCTTEYTNTTLDGEVSVDGGGIQSWTVPSTGTYFIEAWGARAGHKPDNYNAIGGNGAMMSGEFELTQGDVLQIIVGQMGSEPSGSNSSGGSGGGGGSFVFYDVNDALPLLVAGGGGGLGAGNELRADGQPGLTGTSGGDASSSEGFGGSNGSGGEASAANYNSGGGGGWLSDGADGSHPEFCAGGSAPHNGAYGGERGRISHSADGGFGGGGGTNDGGGGGGGYSGGGGGRWSPLYPGGGGGSYNAGSNPNNTSAFNNSHGTVFIDKL